MENKGIGYAINYAIRLSENDACSYLMTMDQDSSFKVRELEGYLNTAEYVFNNNHTIAILGCNRNEYEPKYPNRDWEEVDEVIQSSMLLRLDYVKQIGLFRDDFFIEFVDYEYCYRARSLGFKIAMVTNHQFHHQTGGRKPADFLIFHFSDHNEHNYLRIYYQCRNGLVVSKMYSGMTKRITMMIVILAIKIIGVENDKLRKLRYLIYGVCDGVRNHLGEFI